MAEVKKNVTCWSKEADENKDGIGTDAKFKSC